MYKNEMMSGARLAWENKWQVVSVSLALVIGWQAFGGNVLGAVPSPTVIGYRAEPTQQDKAGTEVRAYVDKVASEIFEQRQDVYREQARQEAIQQVGQELIKLTDNSPHVDYNYMREVVGGM